MVEPLSLLYSTRRAQSCSFNKIHPATKDDSPELPGLCSTPKPLKTNKQPRYLALLFLIILIFSFFIILPSSCRQRLHDCAVENVASLMSYEETASSICVCFSRRMWKIVVIVDGTNCWLVRRESTRFISKLLDLNLTEDRCHVLYSWEPRRYREIRYLMLIPSVCLGVIHYGYNISLRHRV